MLLFKEVWQMADYEARRCEWPGMRYLLERGSGTKYLVYWADCLVRYSLANIGNFANIYISQGTQLQGPRVTG